MQNIHRRADRRSKNMARTDGMIRASERGKCVWVACRARIGILENEKVSNLLLAPAAAKRELLGTFGKNRGPSFPGCLGRERQLA